MLSITTSSTSSAASPMDFEEGTATGPLDSSTSTTRSHRNKAVGARRNRAASVVLSAARSRLSQSSAVAAALQSGREHDGVEEENENDIEKEFLMQQLQGGGGGSGPVVGRRQRTSSASNMGFRNKANNSQQSAFSASERGNSSNPNPNPSRTAAGWVTRRNGAKQGATQRDSVDRSNRGRTSSEAGRQAAEERRGSVGEWNFDDDQNENHPAEDWPGQNSGTSLDSSMRGNPQQTAREPSAAGGGTSDDLSTRPAPRAPRRRGRTNSSSSVSQGLDFNSSDHGVTTATSKESVPRRGRTQSLTSSKPPIVAFGAVDPMTSTCSSTSSTATPSTALLSTSTSTTSSAALQALQSGSAAEEQLDGNNSHESLNWQEEMQSWTMQQQSAILDDPIAAAAMEGCLPRSHSVAGSQQSSSVASNTAGGALSLLLLRRGADSGPQNKRPATATNPMAKKASKLFSPSKSRARNASPPPRPPSSATKKEPRTRRRRASSSSPTPPTHRLPPACSPLSEGPSQNSNIEHLLSTIPSTVDRNNTSNHGSANGTKKSLDQNMSREGHTLDPAEEQDEDDQHTDTEIVCMVRGILEGSRRLSFTNAGANDDEDEDEDEDDDDDEIGGFGDDMELSAPLSEREKRQRRQQGQLDKQPSLTAKLMACQPTAKSQAVLMTPKPKPKPKSQLGGWEVDTPSAQRTPSTSPSMDGSGRSGRNRRSTMSLVAGWDGAGSKVLAAERATTLTGHEVGQGGALVSPTSMESESHKEGGDHDDLSPELEGSDAVLDLREIPRLRPLRTDNDEHHEKSSETEARLIEEGSATAGADNSRTPSERTPTQTVSASSRGHGVEGADPNPSSVTRGDSQQQEPQPQEPQRQADETVTTQPAVQQFAEDEDDLYERMCNNDNEAESGRSSTPPPFSTTVPSADPPELVLSDLMGDPDAELNNASMQYFGNSSLVHSFSNFSGDILAPLVKSKQNQAQHALPPPAVQRKDAGANGGKSGATLTNTSSNNSGKEAATNPNNSTKEKGSVRDKDQSEVTAEKDAGMEGNSEQDRTVHPQQPQSVANSNKDSKTNEGRRKATPKTDTRRKENTRGKDETSRSKDTSKSKEKTRSKAEQKEGKNEARTAGAPRSIMKNQNEKSSRAEPRSEKGERKSATASKDGRNEAKEEHRGAGSSRSRGGENKGVAAGSSRRTSNESRGVSVGNGSDRLVREEDKKKKLEQREKRSNVNGDRSSRREKSAVKTDTTYSDTRTKRSEPPSSSEARPKRTETPARRVETGSEGSKVPTRPSPPPPQPTPFAEVANSKPANGNTPSHTTQQTSSTGEVRTRTRKQPPQTTTTRGGGEAPISGRTNPEDSEKRRAKSGRNRGFQNKPTPPSPPSRPPSPPLTKATSRPRSSSAPVVEVVFHDLTDTLDGSISNGESDNDYENNPATEEEKFDAEFDRMVRSSRSHSEDFLAESGNEVNGSQDNRRGDGLSFAVSSGFEEYGFHQNDVVDKGKKGKHGGAVGKKDHRDDKRNRATEEEKIDAEFDKMVRISRSHSEDFLGGSGRSIQMKENEAAWRLEFGNEHVLQRSVTDAAVSNKSDRGTFRNELAEEDFDAEFDEMVRISRSRSEDFLGGSGRSNHMSVGSRSLDHGGDCSLDGVSLGFEDHDYSHRGVPSEYWTSDGAIQANIGHNNWTSDSAIRLDVERDCKINPGTEEEKLDAVFDRMARFSRSYSEDFLGESGHSSRKEMCGDDGHDVGHDGIGPEYNQHGVLKRRASDVALRTSVKLSGIPDASFRGGSRRSGESDDDAGSFGTGASDDSDSLLDGGGANAADSDDSDSLMEEGGPTVKAEDFFLQFAPAMKHVDMTPRERKGSVGAAAAVTGADEVDNNLFALHHRETVRGECADPLSSFARPPSPISSDIWKFGALTSFVRTDSAMTSRTSTTKSSSSGATSNGSAARPVVRRILDGTSVRNMFRLGSNRNPQHKAQDNGLKESNPATHPSQEDHIDGIADFAVDVGYEQHDFAGTQCFDHPDLDEEVEESDLDVIDSSNGTTSPYCGNKLGRSEATSTSASAETDLSDDDQLLPAVGQTRKTRRGSKVSVVSGDDLTDDDQLLPAVGQTRKTRRGSKSSVVCGDDLSDDDQLLPAVGQTRKMRRGSKISVVNGDNLSDDDQLLPAVGQTRKTRRSSQSSVVHGDNLSDDDQLLPAIGQTRKTRRGSKSSVVSGDDLSGDEELRPAAGRTWMLRRGSKSSVVSGDDLSDDEELLPAVGQTWKSRRGSKSSVARGEDLSDDEELLPAVGRTWKSRRGSKSSVVSRNDISDDDEQLPAAGRTWKSRRGSKSSVASRNDISDDEELLPAAGRTWMSRRGSKSSVVSGNDLSDDEELLPPVGRTRKSRRGSKSSVMSGNDLSDDEELLPAVGRTRKSRRGSKSSVASEDFSLESYSDGDGAAGMIGGSLYDSDEDKAVEYAAAATTKKKLRHRERRGSFQDRIGRSIDATLRRRSSAGHRNIEDVMYDSDEDEILLSASRGSLIPQEPPVPPDAATNSSDAAGGPARRAWGVFNRLRSGSLAATEFTMEQATLAQEVMPVEKPVPSSMHVSDRPTPTGWANNNIKMVLPRRSSHRFVSYED